MSLLTWGETERLTIGDEWIDYKKSLSIADRKAIFSQAGAAFSAGEDGQRMSINPAELNQAIAMRMIKAWSLRFPEHHERAGEPIPVEPRYIEMLRAEVVDDIASRISEGNAQRSDDQVKA